METTLLFAINAVLTTSATAVAAYIQYIKDKTEANRGKLADSVGELDLAYRKFIAAVKNARADLESENTEKVLKDITSYNSDLDSLFNEYQVKINKLLSDFKLFRKLELRSKEKNLKDSAAQLEEVWGLFKEDVRSNKPYHAQKHLDWFCKKVERQVKLIYNLANSELRTDPRRKK